MKLLAPFAGVALALASATNAKPPPQPPEPATHPDWAQVSSVGLGMLKNQLFDPSSAQVVWTSGFQWGFLKPIIGKRSFGWIACGTLNAKNRLGGYVGAQPFLIFMDEHGSITAAMTAEWVSTCDTGPAAALTSDLESLETEPVEPPASLGVAEELLKLAELRDKGIISAEEFEAQKAKLLSR